MTARQLKKLRIKHGVSQTDVAEFLGYTARGKPNRSMISRFENGHAPINHRIALLLHGYFESAASG